MMMMQPLQELMSGDFLEHAPIASPLALLMQVAMRQKPRLGDALTAEIDKQAAGMAPMGRGGAISGEILPPARSNALPGITNLQRAKLGPMLGQLEKLGATPEQIRTFTPVEAYRFIRDRQGYAGE